MDKPQRWQTKNKLEKLHETYEQTKISAQLQNNIDVHALLKARSGAGCGKSARPVLKRGSLGRPSESTQLGEFKKIMAWLSQKEIEQMKFLSVGENVLLSDKASFHNCSKIGIGSNVRVDDFCVLSAGERGIAIGNYIHIAVYSSIIGKGRISIDDFCNISSRVALYSSNDDYSGEYLTNPMVSTQYTNVKNADVDLNKHVIIGSGSIILPGVTLGIGVVVGALSLVKESCEPFGIYAGTPAKYIKKRKQNLLALEKKFLEQQAVTYVP